MEGPSQEPAKAQRLERREAFDGRVLKVCVDRVRLPGGVETELEVVEHPGAAAVVPLTADGDVVLVRQYRYATREWLLEVPAGKRDPGESPEECAVRELAEETGLATTRLVPLGPIWTTPGFADERIWLFLAHVRKGARQDLEPDELLTLVSMPLAEATAMARDGGIADGKSVCALLRAEAVVDGSPER